MMSLRASNYAKVLFSLDLNEEALKRAAQVIQDNSELKAVLENPVIKKKEKEAIIDTVFEKEMQNFIKVLSANKSVGLMNEILEGYEAILLDSKGIITATLSYVTRLEDEELEQIKDMICNKYNKAGVNLELQEDTSLIGGYVLQVNDTIYDKSIKGTLLKLEKTLARR